MIWKDYGTVIEFPFNYIWSSDGSIRANLEQEQIVTVHFNIVQEVHIKNAFNISMVLFPEKINWGSCEVAILEIEDRKDMLYHYNSYPVDFHHAAIKWENDRRIDIVFSDMRIVST
jgi:hypothetical protein